MSRHVWFAIIMSAGGVMLGAGIVGPSAMAQADRPLVPLFEPDPLWSQPLPNKWVTGQVGGVAVDSHDHLWVFHRPATIADGEKAAALNPPQAECCIPAPSVLEFAPTASCFRPGADLRPVSSGRPPSTASSSTTTTTSG